MKKWFCKNAAKPFVFGLVVYLAAGGALAAEHGRHGGSDTVGVCADPEAPASVRCAQGPSGVFDSKGRLWLVWAFHGHVYVNHSDDLASTFSTPVLVNRVPERVAADGENRPKIVLGSGGQLYLSWVQRLPKLYTGNVRFSRSVDGGETFSEPVTVNDNHDITSHRFESMAVAPNGDIYLAWLDKRDRIAQERAGGKYNGAALYYTRSTDDGKSFEPNKKILDHTCECCRTDMAIGPDGLPVIVWRNIYGGNTRDHGIVKFVGADTPGKPIRLSHDDWHVDACPHHGPAVSIGGDGVIHAVWFDNAKVRHGIFYAHSSDGAKSFSKPISVGNYNAVASHADVLSFGRRVYIAWKEFNGERTSVLVTQSDDGGRTWSHPRILASTSGASDHSFLLADGDAAYVSWETADGGFRLLPTSRGNGK